MRGGPIPFRSSIALGLFDRRALAIPFSLLRQKDSSAMISFTVTDARPIGMDPPGRAPGIRDRFDRLLAANGPALARLAASYTNRAAIATTCCRRSPWQSGRRWPLSRRMFRAHLSVSHRAQSRHRLAGAQAFAARRSRRRDRRTDPAPDPESGLRKRRRPSGCGAPSTASPRLPAGHYAGARRLGIRGDCRSAGHLGKQRGRTPDPRPPDSARVLGDTKMNMDMELETWRREWQSETAVPADLRRRVERQSRSGWGCGPT